MADRFYINFQLTPGEIVLQGPEFHHLATVRRLKRGDGVILFNGDGFEYPAQIMEVGRKSGVLEVAEGLRVDRELPFALVIAAAVPKGDREEVLIEKLTELGVTEFVPLITERSVVVPKPDRLRRTVIEASKQCGRNVLMAINEPTPFNAFVTRPGSGLNVIAHPGGPGPGPALPREVRVAIGPEGGWSQAEVAAAFEHGWRQVGLGPRILRVETAAIVTAAYFALSARTA
jgi:16S rRNA (uracil1498-N3)-methyltransferase